MVHWKKKNRASIKAPDPALLKKKNYASGKVPELGAIFMSNSATRQECFRSKVFGLPASYCDFVKQIKGGMLLFLFEYESRSLYGVYQAVSDGKMNICPDAYTSAGIPYPAQVHFRTVWNCEPLSEEEFCSSIQANYFSRHKFNFGLSRSQVRNLLLLFKSKVKRTEFVAGDILSRDVSHLSTQDAGWGYNGDIKNSLTCRSLNSAWEAQYLPLSSMRPEDLTLSKKIAPDGSYSVDNGRIFGDKVNDDGSFSIIHHSSNMQTTGYDGVQPGISLNKNEPVLSSDIHPIISDYGVNYHTSCQFQGLHDSDWLTSRERDCNKYAADDKFMGHREVSQCLASDHCLELSGSSRFVPEIDYLLGHQVQDCYMLPLPQSPRLETSLCPVTADHMVGERTCSFDLDTNMLWNTNAISRRVHVNPNFTGGVHDKISDNVPSALYFTGGNHDQISDNVPTGLNATGRSQVSGDKYLGIDSCLRFGDMSMPDASDGSFINFDLSAGYYVGNRIHPLRTQCSKDVPSVKSLSEDFAHGTQSVMEPIAGDLDLKRIQPLEKSPPFVPLTSRGTHNANLTNVPSLLNCYAKLDSYREHHSPSVEFDSSHQETDSHLPLDFVTQRKRSVFSRLKLTSDISEYAEESNKDIMETNMDALVSEVIEMVIKRPVSEKRFLSKMKKNKCDSKNVQTPQPKMLNTHSPGSTEVNFSIIEGFTEGPNQNGSLCLDFKRRSVVREAHQLIKDQQCGQSSDASSPNKQCKRRKLVRPMLSNRKLHGEGTTDLEGLPNAPQSCLLSKDHAASPLSLIKEQVQSGSRFMDYTSGYEGDADGSSGKPSKNVIDGQDCEQSCNAASTNTQCKIRKLVRPILSHGKLHSEGTVDFEESLNSLKSCQLSKDDVASSLTVDKELVQLEASSSRFSEYTSGFEGKADGSRWKPIENEINGHDCGQSFSASSLNKLRKRRKLVRPILNNRKLPDEGTADIEGSPNALKSCHPSRDDVSSPLILEKEQVLVEVSSSRLLDYTSGAEGHAYGSRGKPSENEIHDQDCVQSFNAGSINKQCKKRKLVRPVLSNRNLHSDSTADFEGSPNVPKSCQPSRDDVSFPLTLEKEQVLIEASSSRLLDYTSGAEGDADGSRGKPSENEIYVQDCVQSFNAASINKQCKKRNLVRQILSNRKLHNDGTADLDGSPNAPKSCQLFRDDVASPLTLAREQVRLEASSSIQLESPSGVGGDADGSHGKPSENEINDQDCGLSSNAACINKQCKKRKLVRPILCSRKLHDEGAADLEDSPNAPKSCQMSEDDVSFPLTLEKEQVLLKASISGLLEYPSVEGDADCSYGKPSEYEINDQDCGQRSNAASINKQRKLVRPTLNRKLHDRGTDLEGSPNVPKSCQLSKDYVAPPLTLDEEQVQLEASTSRLEECTTSFEGNADGSCGKPGKNESNDQDCGKRSNVAFINGQCKIRKLTGPILCLRKLHCEGTVDLEGSPTSCQLSKDEVASLLTLDKEQLQLEASSSSENEKEVGMQNIFTNPGKGDKSMVASMIHGSVACFECCLDKDSIAMVSREKSPDAHLGVEDGGGGKDRV